MISIKTEKGTIMAETVIAGIPVDPEHPPSMSFIDPHRRWQVQAESIWMRKSWIVSEQNGYVVRHIRPTSYRPEEWGRFATLQQAVDYIAAGPTPHIPSDWSDEDMDF
jgi:hypothetical protein